MSQRNTKSRRYLVQMLLSAFVLCGILSSAVYAADDTKNQTNSNSEISQTFGIGLRLGGSHFGVGANARYWSQNRVGFELGYSHSSIGFPDVGYDASVNQVIPSFLLALSKVDRPSCFIRPYVGGGITFSRSSSSLNLSSVGLGNNKDSVSNVGGQGFVGTELTFKKVPKLAFGADLGYYSTAIPFTGIKIGGFAIAATIHYYVK
jgi:hypothetical protein